MPTNNIVKKNCTSRHISKQLDMKDDSGRYPYAGTELPCEQWGLAPMKNRKFLTN